MIIEFLQVLKTKPAALKQFQMKFPNYFLTSCMLKNPRNFRIILNENKQISGEGEISVYDFFL